ncbi:apolipo protein O-domain-containing protein [Lasiosphaeris hirsuta]|uniref:MICOS complex subunit n=1 Tax=Lasiosphaeris hirsuta TaxID=260670 RepID=A0AA40EAV6_9PEZI|nr:apolipo protein O-domain-containing protein [Lasiosphaeris hirsuta]
MAARVLLQRRAAPLTAAVTVGSIAFYPRVAHAEAPTERQYSKKPIYDDDFDSLPPPTAKPAPRPTPRATETVTTTTTSTETKVAPASFPAAGGLTKIATTIDEVTTPQRRPTPTARLAAQIRLGRLFLYKQAATAEDAVNSTMARAFSLEHSFTSTIASLAPPRESGERLLPGLIYVLVAGMAGSIVARNRGVLLRASAPLALGIGAAWVVLPVTMTNVSGLAWKYEQRFPAVAEAHISAREGVAKGVSFAKVHGEVATRRVTEAVADARETVEGWVRKGK